MHNAPRLGLREGLRERALITNVTVDKLEVASARARPDLRQIPLLDLARIEQIEVVKPNVALAAPQHRRAHVRADEPRRAGDQNWPRHRAPVCPSPLGEWLYWCL